MPTQWYFDLVKPTWTPPGETIGLIWSILYPVIIFCFIWVSYKYFKGQIPSVIFWVFLANLIANLIFSPIQFWLQNLPLATLDILAVLGTIIAGMVLVFPYSKLIFALQIPYLVWVATATVLQISITWMNR